MTETNSKTYTYCKNDSQFSGIITIDDFNTQLPNKNRINNQAHANQMQEEFMNKINQQKKLERYRKMTMKELQEMKIVSNTDGRPSDTLTDEKWQKEFEVRKLFVHPNDQKHTKMNGPYSREPGVWNDKSDAGYPGPTNWQSYCSYMNDVLRNIRSGQTDYCYFIYQILDLLKFHYNTLHTRYCNGYWEVWLEQ